MSRPNTIRYQPALDGLRALAVAAVLLFHAGLGWMSGGYLGVSVFFTLSGFLITSLLLTESKATGSVDARSFYTRRARRLLPASVVCVSAVSVLAAANMFKGAAHVRRDVLGALFQVFNWVKLGSGESYADLNSAIAGVRQPLDHYWSLAIEEQFYWLWPLTFLVLLWWRRRRPAFSIGLAVTGLFLMAAVAAPLISVQWGPDAAYWATPARASEILAGAVVACWLVQGRRGLALDRPVAAPSDPAAGRRGLMPGWLSWLAPLCLLALAAACVLFPDGSGPAYDGALPLVGVTSAGLILGLQVAGPVRRLLSIKPLVAIGKVSYGVYLYHWPIYVLVDRQQWDVPVGVSLLIKVAITAVVTVVSYFLIERPIRRAEWLVPRRTLIGALTLTTAAQLLDCGLNLLSRLERGITKDQKHALTYQQWLTDYQQPKPLKTVA